MKEHNVFFIDINSLETVKKINDSSSTPDLTSFKEDIDKLNRVSTTIKEVLKTDSMKEILQDEVKAEDEFQKEEVAVGETEKDAVLEDATPDAILETPANEGKESEAPANEEVKTDVSLGNPDVTLETPTSDGIEKVETTNKKVNPVVSESDQGVNPEIKTEIPPVDAAISSEITTETLSNDVKEEPPLTLDDLKISPAMKNKQSNEMGKYIFVPEKMVQLVVDYLLSNGCEITTTVMK